MRIFLASPFFAPTPEGIAANVALARRLCAEVIAGGHSPYAPHLLMPQFLDDANPADRERGIRAGLDFLRVCDEVWCWSTVSMGMAAEIRHAAVEGKIVRFPWGVPVVETCPVCLRLMDGEVGVLGVRSRKLVMEWWPKHVVEEEPIECPLCATVRSRNWPLQPNGGAL